MTSLEACFLIAMSVLFCWFIGMQLWGLAGLFSRMIQQDEKLETFEESLNGTRDKDCSS